MDGVGIVYRGYTTDLTSRPGYTDRVHAASRRSSVPSIPPEQRQPADKRVTDQSSVNRDHVQDLSTWRSRQPFVDRTVYPEPAQQIMVAEKLRTGAKKMIQDRPRPLEKAPVFSHGAEENAGGTGIDLDARAAAVDRQPRIMDLMTRTSGGSQWSQTRTDGRGPGVAAGTTDPGGGTGPPGVDGGSDSLGPAGVDVDTSTRSGGLAGVDVEGPRTPLSGVEKFGFHDLQRRASLIEHNAQTARYVEPYLNVADMYDRKDGAQAGATLRPQNVADNVGHMRLEQEIMAREKMRLGRREAVIQPNNPAWRDLGIPATQSPGGSKRDIAFSNVALGVRGAPKPDLAISPATHSAHEAQDLTPPAPRFNFISGLAAMGLERNRVDVDRQLIVPANLVEVSPERVPFPRKDRFETERPFEPLDLRREAETQILAAPVMGATQPPAPLAADAPPSAPSAPSAPLAGDPAAATTVALARASRASQTPGPDLTVRARDVEYQSIPEHELYRLEEVHDRRLNPVLEDRQFDLKKREPVLVRLESQPFSEPQDLERDFFQPQFPPQQITMTQKNGTPFNHQDQYPHQAVAVDVPEEPRNHTRREFTDLKINNVEKDVENQRVEKITENQLYGRDDPRIQEVIRLEEIKIYDRFDKKIEYMEGDHDAPVEKRRAEMVTPREPVQNVDNMVFGWNVKR